VEDVESKLSFNGEGGGEGIGVNEIETGGWARGGEADSSKSTGREA